MMMLHKVLRIVLTLYVATLIVSPHDSARAEENPLAVINGGVQRSEDAPYVPASFQFLPGDYVYFTFYISGFATKTNPDTEAKTMSVEYEVTPEDAHHVPLTELEKGSISDILTTEDKNWIPKRRASFLLPSYVAAGQFMIHVVIKDLLGKKEATRDYPFLMGGVQVDASDSVKAQNFQFLRNENDEKPLELPAYAPGDTVWARFEMAGFKHEEQNQYKLSYGINILSPDGKTFLDQPEAAQIASSNFYPAQFVPGDLQITTPKNARRGAYQLTLTVRDLIGNQSFDLKRVFTIE
jgi:hypothetical protein